jgi:excisionase family DNA binding protein
MKTLEERKAILEAEIIKQQKKGWLIANRTDTTCQLTKEKKPETCLIVILFLLFVIPGLLYLIITKGNVTVYIEITDEGEIKYSGKDLSPYELEQLKKEYVDTVVNGRKLSQYEIEMREKAVAAAGGDKKTVSQTPVMSQTTNALGLLTTSEIADGLKISEEEVVKLIETGQLKGKKIGDKYFIRKDDFDEFMKK